MRKSRDACCRAWSAMVIDLAACIIIEKPAPPQELKDAMDPILRHKPQRP